VDKNYQIEYSTKFSLLTLRALKDSEDFIRSFSISETSGS